MSHRFTQIYTDETRMSKWIQFVDRGIPTGKKTRIWTVHPFDGVNSNLGEVRWYSPWRQYAFYPTSLSLFEKECLRDIADFCESKTQDHRKSVIRENPCPSVAKKMNL
jgi:hypothetical protein